LSLPLASATSVMRKPTRSSGSIIGCFAAACVCIAGRSSSTRVMG
jgi:hypothetical protein